MGKECKFHEDGTTRDGYPCGRCTHPDDAADDWECGMGCPGYQLRKEEEK